MGLHRGSVLSPFLFALVMDELTRSIQEEVHGLGRALLYGASVGDQERTCPKMHVAEMRMLRWMCGHTRSDRIRSEVIREKVGVASVVDKGRRG
ncbi:hypothetical protein H5410_037726 [Solanum commersonii]|uniref:Reverse transcriptase domain-containing protein n=1 Tax=Solanum commersonii TaxID=4109 RepID=A0A9J5YBZ3_SOLCO|nr:hypothetical protein H5410_037726 [Solanum commersonii]